MSKQLKSGGNNINKKGTIFYYFIKIFKYLKWHLVLKPYHSIKKILRRVYLKIKRCLKIFKIFKYNFDIDKILEEHKNTDRIILWRNDNFGWNVKLFQRPQHIAREFARNNCLYFYEVTDYSDNVSDFQKIEDNLYLVNFNNRIFANRLISKLKKVDKVKYVQIYSTELSLTVEELKKYISWGFKVIYEYIDDLSPAISVKEELPINIQTKYDYVMKDKENSYIVVTADNIAKDVERHRDENDYVFACNGVDYNHFNNLDHNFKVNEQMEKIITQGKPIIGYYGALATWFDYEMVIYLAKSRPEYNIVLIGVKYDDSYDKQQLNKYENIHFLGSINYNELPNYARHFTICTIPFLINEITQSTSPLKLFEYMALSKPIVTTAMHECKKYESVFIANNKEEFIKLTDYTINLTPDNNPEYFDLLKKEALENSWNQKAETILEYLEKQEKQ